MGIKYFDTTKNKNRLFYPDWIVKLDDCRICILDTKAGDTAKSQETRDKAEALQKRIEYLNSVSKIKYIGGIVIKANNQWYIQSEESNLSNSGWKTLSWKAL